MAQSSTRDRAASKPGAVQSKSRHGFFRFVGNAVAAYTQWLVVQSLRIDFLNKAGWRAYRGPWIECGSVRDRCSPLEGRWTRRAWRFTCKHRRATSRRRALGLMFGGAVVLVAGGPAPWLGGTARPRKRRQSRPPEAGPRRPARRSTSSAANVGVACPDGSAALGAYRMGDRPHWTTSASPVGRSSWSPIRAASDAPLTRVVLESPGGRPLEDTCSASVEDIDVCDDPSGCDVHVGWAFR